MRLISIQRSQGIYYTPTVTKGSEHILSKTISCVLKPRHIFIDHFGVSDFAVVQLLEVGFKLIAMNVFGSFALFTGTAVDFSVEDGICMILQQMGTHKINFASCEVLRTQTSFYVFFVF